MIGARGVRRGCRSTFYHALQAEESGERERAATEGCPYSLLRFCIVGAALCGRPRGWGMDKGLTPSLDVGFPRDDTAADGNAARQQSQEKETDEKSGQRDYR